MTLKNTLYHILRHYYRVFFDSFPSKLPSDLQLYQNECEDLVGRYNILLKKISEYMKDHCKQHEDMPYNSDLILTYQDTDSFFLISIKEDLENLTDDCEELLEKGELHPSEIQLHNDAVEQNINKLNELRQYSEQIETALNEYEENIMKIEEEISNNTLCN